MKYSLLILLLFSPTFLWAVDWEEFSHTVKLRIHKHNITSICSGALLNEDVVLTAAHCLIGATRVQVNASPPFLPQDYHHAKDFKLHSDYRGNYLINNVDLALIFLQQPLYGAARPVTFSSAVPHLPFERVGLGEREGQNRRTWVTSTYSGQVNQVLELHDSLGVVGDSGGPVFQRQEHQLVLVGIHTGRKMDSAGNLLNISFTQMIGPYELRWINKNR